MRVAYDDQIVSLHRSGGISRYFVELVSKFRGDPTMGITPVINWASSPNEHARAAGLSRMPSKIFGARIVRRGLREFSKKVPSDIVHHTFYATRALDRHYTGVRAVTVYDMIPERLPELFPQGNPHWAKAEYVHRADLVLCISESTRSDLAEFYGHIAAKIVVTSLASAPPFRPGIATPAGLPLTYVLYVGSRSTYKDFVVAVDAVRNLTRDLPDLHLVAVGGGALTTHEQTLLKHRGMLNKVHQHDLDDEGLAGAYAGAVCFVFPSRYEGFGLPTLEAMACGCPVVLANGPALKEVGGNAAIYFPAGDDSALGASILRLINDPWLRAIQIAGGLTRAAHFSWKRTASETADAYRLVYP